ncbi:hypothetical protein LG943_25960 [Streptomonospora sp. S1-112]|uniref:Uncharacterized protein n=1 Tax=Streptomonospora mangrovi TaxID=2883123 RepID=A0A9X3NVM6_9ACTN|nr:hypothetical protein [Streptomonospora mangrovi]MDA0567740.1 hypothetical protein [Streptomonospora mangrovi]
MQPNAQQPGAPAHGRPPAAGGPAPWGGGPSPQAARPKRRANTAAAVAAGALALITSGFLFLFAVVNVVIADVPSTGPGAAVVATNIAAGVGAAVVLLVPAGFTVARRIAGAWTLCGLCLLYVVANVALAPVLWGTPVLDQLVFLFGFRGIDDAAIGLASICCLLTAVAAAVAGSVTSLVPTAAGPRRR